MAPGFHVQEARGYRDGLTHLGVVSLCCVVARLHHRCIASIVVVVVLSSVGRSDQVGWERGVLTIGL